MKSHLLVFFTCICLANYAQNPSSGYLASTGGIGPFKIGLSKAAVEKLTGAKIVLPKNMKDPESYEWDTVKCRYKELDVEIVFSKAYYGNDTAARMGVYQVTSKSASLSTKSGIVIGDDKLKIFKTYDQYRLEYYPDWDRKLNPLKAQVMLYDNETSNVLVFYLYNGIITGFGASIMEGD